MILSKADRLDGNGEIMLPSSIFVSMRNKDIVIPTNGDFVELKGSTLKYSLDNGESWHTEGEIKEALDANTKDTKCEWTRSFDGHFNISCVNKTGERANGNFKGKEVGAKWEFRFCPYCSGEIVKHEPK